MNQRTVWLLGLSLGCAGSDDDDGGTDTDTDEPVDQAPPQGYALLQPWLESGEYNGWTCQPDTHVPGELSPHATARICSNDLATGHTSGEYPVGAVYVKELYDDSGVILGHALQAKVGTGLGESWYWYEHLPPGTVVVGLTIDANGVVADGLGDSGQADTVCVNCHQVADVDHVFVQVE